MTPNQREQAKLELNEEIEAIYDKMIKLPADIRQPFRLKMRKIWEMWVSRLYS